MVQTLNRRKSNENPEKRAKPVQYNRGAVMHSQNSPEIAFKKIGIIGLGLIGGSLAKAFRHIARIERIVVADVSRVTADAAVADGCADEIVAMDSPDFVGSFDGCDALFICIPPHAACEMVARFKGADVGIVTDVTSVRKSLKGYSLPFVDASMIMLASVVIQSYIMYTVSPEVTARVGTDNLYATSIFVVLGMMRYFQLTLLEQRSGSPVKLIFTDRPIQLILLGWILTFGIMLYAI